MCHDAFYQTPWGFLGWLTTTSAVSDFSHSLLHLPDKAVRQQTASALDLILQVSRFPDGSRRLVNISEVTGMEGSVVTMQDIFTFERQGYDESNRVRGQFRPTGIRPQFSERLFARGIRLPADMFATERYPMVAENRR